MHLNWDKLREFLRSLGVDMEVEDTQESAEESITLLQRSQDHEALYRVDFLETGPELLVLLPSMRVPFKFHFYLVTLRQDHPFSTAVGRLLDYQGSDDFEQMRELVEWHCLYAIVETMKALFWLGQETSQFPPEISVQRLGCE
ncbi:hypothetical protein ccbrp13_20220 [Ktedonobacteria bacterium brp13]|nr:hypothetical protein ccbrp13_20220 [Ktedonobacteria bacterium brp13]